MSIKFSRNPLSDQMGNFGPIVAQIYTSLNLRVWCERFLVTLNNYKEKEVDKNHLC